MNLPESKADDAFQQRMPVRFEAFENFKMISMTEELHYFKNRMAEVLEGIQKSNDLFTRNFKRKGRSKG